MLNLVVLSLVLVVPGVLAGGAAGYLVARRFRIEPPPPATAAHAPLDLSVEQEVQAASTRWAEQEGRPEIAPLLAQKLHMLIELGQRRDRRQP
jgi:hypothetical protein